MSTRNDYNFVSIIVPVYNAETTITRCLNSIEDQTFTDYNVIIVNDCSTDSSAELVSAFVLNKPNFRLINLPLNGGVSNARNIGIQRSNSKHLMFVDSDDYIRKDYLQSLIDASDGVELACSAFQLIDGDFDRSGRNHGLLNSQLITVESLKTYLKNFYLKPYYFTLFLHVWNKLFLRRIVSSQDILFDETLSQLEDVHFVSRYLMHVNQINFTSNDGYLHCRDNRGHNLSSISGFGGKTAVDKFINALEPVSQLEAKLFGREDEKLSLEYSHFLSSMSLLFCLRIARRFWQKPNLSSVLSVYIWLSDKRLRVHRLSYLRVSGESEVLRASVRKLPAALSSPIVLFFGILR